MVVVVVILVVTAVVWEMLGWNIIQERGRLRRGDLVSNQKGCVS